MVTKIWSTKTIRGHLQISLLIKTEFKRMNSLIFPTEIITKPMVFWWFQGEQKLINLLYFTYNKKRNLEMNPKLFIAYSSLHSYKYLWCNKSYVFSFEKKNNFFSQSLCNASKNVMTLYNTFGSIAKRLGQKLTLIFFIIIWSAGDEAFEAVL